eukprot:GSA25T00027483001.1
MLFLQNEVLLASLVQLVLHHENERGRAAQDQQARRGDDHDQAEPHPHPLQRALDFNVIDHKAERDLIELSQQRRERAGSNYSVMSSGGKDGFNFADSVADEDDFISTGSEHIGMRSHRTAIASLARAIRTRKAEIYPRTESLRSSILQCADGELMASELNSLMSRFCDLFEKHTAARGMAFDAGTFGKELGLIYAGTRRNNNSDDAILGRPAHQQGASAVPVRQSNGAHSDRSTDHEYSMNLSPILVHSSNQKLEQQHQQPSQLLPPLGVLQPQNVNDQLVVQHAYNTQIQQQHQQLNYNSMNNSYISREHSRHSHAQAQVQPQQLVQLLDYTHSAQEQMAGGAGAPVPQQRMQQHQSNAQPPTTMSMYAPGAPGGRIMMPAVEQPQNLARRPSIPAVGGGVAMSRT